MIPHGRNLFRSADMSTCAVLGDLTLNSQLERDISFCSTDVADAENKITLNREEILYGHRIYWFFRRLQDIIFSTAALIVLAPMMAVIALLVYLDDPHGSPIFKQERCGRDGKLFTFYKFRSMVVDAESKLDELLRYNESDGHAFKMKNDPRITKVGRVIRHVSLDELPQLWNILKGDMSIVGPRPALPREVEHYNDYQRQRLYVTPGLTCYWQVREDRYQLSFDEWVDLDIKYIQDRSFLLDWKLIFLTVKAVFNGSGE